MSHKVSVVVPTYQRADVLPRALQSVARQTYSPIELIVVDDGSTDDTREVVEAFGARCARDATHVDVLYSFQENAGCAAARARGLSMATGEWVQFLDSDDVLEPDGISALLAAARQNDAAFAYGPAIEVTRAGVARLNRPVAAGEPDTLAAALFLHPNVRNGAVLFRSDVARGVGFDTTLRHNEDTDLLLRVAAKHRGAYTPTPPVRVHHHSGNKSRDRVAVTRALIRSANRALQEYPELARELGDAAETRLRELDRQLVRALVLQGDLGQAASSPAHAIRLLDRLCIRLGTELPARAWAWTRARLGRPAVA